MIQTAQWSYLSHVLPGDYQMLLSQNSLESLESYLHVEKMVNQSIIFLYQQYFSRLA